MLRLSNAVRVCAAALSRTRRCYEKALNGCRTGLVGGKGVEGSDPSPGGEPYKGAEFSRASSPTGARPQECVSTRMSCLTEPNRVTTAYVLSGRHQSWYCDIENYRVLEIIQSRIDCSCLAQAAKTLPSGLLDTKADLACPSKNHWTVLIRPRPNVSAQYLNISN